MAHSPTRFTLELEFVELLANPMYLQRELKGLARSRYVLTLTMSADLAQNRYFDDPSFLNYIGYLQYWHQPEYIKYVGYGPRQSDSTSSRSCCVCVCVCVCVTDANSAAVLQPPTFVVFPGAVAEAGVSRQAPSPTVHRPPSQQSVLALAILQVESISRTPLSRFVGPKRRGSIKFCELGRCEEYTRAHLGEPLATEAIQRVCTTQNLPTGGKYELQKCRKRHTLNNVKRQRNECRRLSSSTYPACGQ